MRAKFLLQPTARHDYFQQLLKVAKVVEVKAKDKTATVTLEFTDPFQKKKVTQPAVLAYEVRGGAYLLDLEATDLSRVLVALADGEHPIRADFDGIAGVFSAARPTIVGIRRSLGRGELRKDDLKLKPQPNIDMDHIELSRALLFGDLAVGYLDLKDDYGIITSLDIIGPGFRTRDGLGVGSALADFGAYQTVDIRAFGKYNLMRDMHPPLLPDGKLDQYRIVGALHPSQKSGLALFLDAQDRVQAIGFKVGSTQAEKL